MIWGWVTRKFTLFSISSSMSTRVLTLINERPVPCNYIMLPDSPQKQTPHFLRGGWKWGVCFWRLVAWVLGVLRYWAVMVWYWIYGRHSKLYCLCNRDIQTFIVCAIDTFKTLLFVQSRHSKLYFLCNRDIQTFIVCAIRTFKTLLFVQSGHSKLYCLCKRAIRNFIVCVSLLGLRTRARPNNADSLWEIIDMLSSTFWACSTTVDESALKSWWSTQHIISRWRHSRMEPYPGLRQWIENSSVSEGPDW